jgi:hypothetical protein
MTPLSKLTNVNQSNNDIKKLYKYTVYAKVNISGNIYRIQWPMTETRPYPQRARARITGSKVLTRLIDHVEGKIELSNSQVNAARILLGKILPDMKSVEMDVHARVNEISVHQLTNEQLMAIASQGLKDIEGEAVPTPKKLKVL